MSDTKPMPVTILAWRPLAKGSLLGFAEVRLGRYVGATRVRRHLETVIVTPV